MNLQELHLSVIKNTRFTFARSSGVGGQNVNKVNTKVHATLELDLIQGISTEEREVLQAKLASCINKEGQIYIDVQDERFQERNREIALQRLESKICKALKPKKKRVNTKPTKSSIEKRLKLKKIKSLIKQSRNWKVE